MSRSGRARWGIRIGISWCRRCLCVCQLYINLGDPCLVCGRRLHRMIYKGLECIYPGERPCRTGIRISCPHTAKISSSVKGICVSESDSISQSIHRTGTYTQIYFLRRCVNLPCISINTHRLDGGCCSEILHRIAVLCIFGYIAHVSCISIIRCDTLPVRSRTSGNPLSVITGAIGK